MNPYLNVKKHLSLLGKKAVDKVTGAQGVVDSVCFDLYGCIQASINNGFDSEGKRKDSYWFDVARLEIVSHIVVMDPPDYEFGPQAEGRQGAADRPAPGERA